MQTTNYLETFKKNFYKYTTRTMILVYLLGKCTLSLSLLYKMNLR